MNRNRDLYPPEMHDNISMCARSRYRANIRSQLLATCELEDSSWASASFDNLRLPIHSELVKAPQTA